MLVVVVGVDSDVGVSHCCFCFGDGERDGGE